MPLKSLVLVSVLILFGALTAITHSSRTEKDVPLKSNLTIYVGEPLRSQGGAVIVASVPIPVEEWRDLDGDNPAQNDPKNAKRNELSEDDRLFGAFIHGPVSYVEMHYPEGGTFSFDFVPDTRVENPNRLSTERILVGDGGWYDRSTDTRHEWPDVSTIHIAGSSALQSNTRLVRFHQNDILNLGPDRQIFSGATVYTPSDQQIAKGTSGNYE